MHISGNAVGLVQSRQNFLLANDAYPKLENAFIFREQIRRKQGVQYINGSSVTARLSRGLTAASSGNISSAGAGIVTYNLITGLISAGSITSVETSAEIVPGNIRNITITIGVQTLTDTLGTGTFVVSAGVITAATINYSTGDLFLTYAGAGGPSASAFTGYYYPGLPVMGIRIEELSNSAFDKTIVFDTRYSYELGLTTWQEFQPGTVWTGSDIQFFWTTNYWIDNASFKIFWATNNNDPIRFTNGQLSGWFDFAPIINAGGGTLVKALAMLPFRGRMVAFNVTQAGSDGGTFTNRIRWAAIGTPFTQAYGTIIDIANVNVNAWRDDIRGQGGFLDIPTSEDIVAVGFVRDNCVIYCERSTWQLRYTSRSIAPFQIERVNSELGAQSTFSAVEFDTSLIGVGNRGVVECDSFKSERIDIKIPDLVFEFSNENNGTYRVYGIRDFVSKLAYWTYVSDESTGTYPDKILTYNYDNDSWAIFDHSFTCFGQFQLAVDTTWLTSDLTWEEADFTWEGMNIGDPVILAGNQNGFVVQMPNQLNGSTVNCATLSIQQIDANGPDEATVIVSPNHNLINGDVIKISEIPASDPFVDLNGQVFSIVIVDDDSFSLWKYNTEDEQFSTPQINNETDPYLGSGRMAVLDNFSIVSKKFNFMDQGQSIQLGYFDILMDTTGNGAISVNIYIDYDEDAATNIYPQNVIPTGVSEGFPDVFFNSVIPTSKSTYSEVSASKYWQRVVCPTRGNFITIEYNLSNAQMAGVEQANDVQIDSQILWVRPAGRILQPF